MSDGTSQAGDGGNPKMDLEKKNKGERGEFAVRRFQTNPF